MDHEQSKKPVFKKVRPIIGAQPGRGWTKNNLETIWPFRGHRNYNRGRTILCTLSVVWQGVAMSNTWLLPPFLTLIWPLGMFLTVDMSCESNMMTGHVKYMPNIRKMCSACIIHDHWWVLHAESSMLHAEFSCILLKGSSYILHGHSL